MFGFYQTSPFLCVESVAPNCLNGQCYGYYCLKTITQLRDNRSCLSNLPNKTMGWSAVKRGAGYSAPIFREVPIDFKSGHPIQPMQAVNQQ